MEQDGEDVVDETEEESFSSFASELDVALDRNGSEFFGHFHGDIWDHVRSLADILHHADTIVKILLGPISHPGEK